MITGSTPLHTFELELEHMPKIVELLISYAQNGRVILRKYLKDCTVDGNRISTKLSQEDTLKFNESHSVRIQIKLKTPTEDVIVSDIVATTPSMCLDLEVI